MTKQELTTKEFDTYYQRYIDKVSENVNVIQGFTRGKNTVIDFFSSISEELLTYRYQPEKWSIKEVLQHLIDTERIFMYRCFRIARRDTTDLTGFDQNIYISPSRADEKPIEALLNEFTINRNHSINLLQSFTTEDLSAIGNANGCKMSARAAAFTILGHDIWHMEIVKERYL